MVPLLSAHTTLTAGRPVRADCQLTDISDPLISVSQSVSQSVSESFSQLTKRWYNKHGRQAGQRGRMLHRIGVTGRAAKRKGNHISITPNYDGAVERWRGGSESLRQLALQTSAPCRSRSRPESAGARRSPPDPVHRRPERPALGACECVHDYKAQLLSHSE